MHEQAALGLPSLLDMAQFCRSVLILWQARDLPVGDGPQVASGLGTLPPCTPRCPRKDRGEAVSWEVDSALAARRSCRLQAAPAGSIHCNALTY
jgi:hypothetical protein